MFNLADVHPYARILDGRTPHENAKQNMVCEICSTVQWQMISVHLNLIMKMQAQYLSNSHRFHNLGHRLVMENAAVSRSNSSKQRRKTDSDLNGGGALRATLC